MKKKCITLIVAGVMSASLAACGGSKASTTQDTSVQAETEQTETAGQEETPAAQDTEESADSTETAASVSLANPWHEATYQEAFDTVSKLFKAPEGAENIKWSICDNGKDVLDVPGPIVQMTFDLDGQSYTAREQVTGDEALDISGMFYDWTVSEDITLANWADGQMTGKYQRYIGEDESVDVCTWYDIEYGASYSLSTSAQDLDGFDLQAIAEAIYDPSTQPGANMPEDADPIEADNISVDITGCDNLDQIIDKLSTDMGYARMKLDDTDVLLVAQSTYNGDDKGTKAATEAEVYWMGKDEILHDGGSVRAGGTANPLTASGDFIYAGGHHYVKRYTLKDDIFAIDEEATEEFDADGKVSYFLHSELHEVDAGENGEVKDDTALNKLNEEMFSADIISFTVVK